MRRRRFGGVFVLLILFVFQAPVRAGFEIRNSQLFLEDERFLIRGVVYGNTPIGARWSDGPEPAGCLYARDFPLIAGMGANTLRTRAIVSPEDSAFRRSLADARLYWLAGFPLDRFYDPERSLSPSTGLGRALRGQIIEEFQAFVEGWREEERIIAFVFGDEVGRDYEEKFAGSPTDFYSLLRDAAEVLVGAQGGTALLTTTVAGAFQIGDFTLGTDDLSQPGLSFWSLDAVGDVSLEELFAAVSNRTAKPLLVSAFGVDAYDQQGQIEDASTQAEVGRALASEIEWQLPGDVFPVLGGLWASYVDEWWRGGEAPSLHSTDGWPDQSFPDNYRNPAWFGLFRAESGPIAGFDTLRPREAYFALAHVWGGLPPDELSAGAGPLINEGGVVGAAGGRPAIAPGGLVSLWGEGFALGSRSAGTTVLPNHLGPVSACLQGEAVPLLFADRTEVRGQAPWAAPLGVAEAFVYRAGVASNVATVEVAASAPGIFDRGVYRAGLPCPVNEANGIPPGSYLEVYGSGLGPATAELADGMAPAGGVLTLNVPLGRLGSEPVPVVYAGLLEGIVGVYQTNIFIPEDFPPSSVDLRLTQDGVASNPHLLRVIDEGQPPGFSISGPEPNTLVVQQGGPSRTAFVEIEGFNSFCDLVRFQISGLPTGVRASIPVGVPGESLPLTLSADPGAPRIENVPVSLTALTVLPEIVTRSFLLTVLPSLSDVRFRVVSGGYKSAASVAAFEVDGTLAYEVHGGGPGRGFNFLTVDPRTGLLGTVRNFDTWAREEDVTAMEVYLRSLPDGTVVIGAIADEGAFFLTDQARATIQETLGSYFIDLLDYQFSWAIITRKAAPAPIAEGLGPAEIVVLDEVLTFPMD